MRKTRRIQPSLTEVWLDLDHAKELAKISEILDSHPTICELVLQDLRRISSAKADTGVGGMSAEQVLRALLIKQMNGFSYRELAYHLADSRTYQTFCRLGLLDKPPKKSALAKNIKALRPQTLESIHRILVRAARELKIERGEKTRVDATAVESPIHHPTDSELLWDCVRKITDLMLRARELLGAQRVVFADRRRRAKRRRKEINNAPRKKKRTKAYRDLIRVTEEVMQMGLKVRCQLASPPVDLDLFDALAAQGVGEKLEHFLALADRVLDQARQRVLEGESVPAAEKIVSIFEEHTDIIRKDNRETIYGHKIFLTVGASSMILDCLIPRGNPADSTLAETMVDRQIEILERPPRQTAFDGCFASAANLRAIKDKGVEDVAFSKSRGLEIHEMVRSTWVYRRLRRFRAGIEGIISFLKRAFVLRRCTWRSWPSFQSYVWSSILACNLLVMARHLIG